VIEKVPGGHYKEIYPREVNAICELHVFIVPAKAQRTERNKIVRYRPINFYKVEPLDPGRISQI